MTQLLGELPSVETRTLTDEEVVSYRENGFLHLKGVLTPQEVKRYRAAAAHAYDAIASLDGDNQMFRQIVQVWKSDSTLRQLTLHPGLASYAVQLAGMPVRLWHDQLLIKKPHNHTPTEFHQDSPYWPHPGGRHQLSAWVALVDVPVERGCMTFIPGSQHRTDLRAQDLTDAADLFRVAPDLVWSRRVTIPLRAGDCTFHNAYTGHGATPNLTDDPRIAHVVIYVDAEASYSGAPHVVTDPLGLEVGAVLPDEHFPPVAAF